MMNPYGVGEGDRGVERTCIFNHKPISLWLSVYSIPHPNFSCSWVFRNRILLPPNMTKWTKNPHTERLLNSDPFSLYFEKPPFPGCLGRYSIFYPTRQNIYAASPRRVLVSSVQTLPGSIDWVQLFLKEWNLNWLGPTAIIAPQRIFECYRYWLEGLV